MKHALDPGPHGPIAFAITHSAAGGLREIWNDIAEGLQARGVTIDRFVFYPPPLSEAETADRAVWHHIVEQRPGTPWAALRMFAALVRYLRHTRPSAVIGSMPAADVILPLAVMAARVPTRVFLSHHSPTDTHNRLLDWLDGWTGSLPCVDAVVSVSDAVAATLEHKPRRYRAKRMTIHNALPERIERLIDRLARPSASRDEPRRIIALGRLSRQKNYPMLLDAMALLPGATLEIVGAGEDEAALRAQAARLALGDRLVLAGQLPREAALARAACADIFVQISLYEGHSLALVEAARLGLPLVVSDVPVQREGVTAPDGTCCGIVVPLGDAAALARHLDRLIADPAEHAHWARLARQLAKHASNKAMLDRYQALLIPDGRGPLRA